MPKSRIFYLYVRVNSDVYSNYCENICTFVRDFNKCDFYKEEDKYG